MSTPTDAYISTSYASKPAHYFHGGRADLVNHLMTGPESLILEIGCGSGGTGALALAQGKCGAYFGIEIEPKAAAAALTVLTDVQIGNVETMEMPFPRNHFDAIIASEVLEHLTDPWAVMKKLVERLKPGGQLIATVPNISHWRIILSLMKGKFVYTEMGIMDRTHLRWFTPASFRDMAECAGLKVVRISPPGPFGLIARVINAVTGARFSHLFHTQIALLSFRPLQ